MTLDTTDDNSAAVPSAGRRRLQSAHDVREHRRRRLTWGLSLALFVLLVNSIVGENGYLTTVRQGSERATLESVVAQLRIENQRLQQEGRQLQQNPAALEEAARRSLGLVGPGEVLVIVTPARQASRPGASSR